MMTTAHVEESFSATFPSSVKKELHFHCQKEFETFETQIS